MNRRTRRMSAPGSRRDYEMCKVGTTSPAPRCFTGQTTARAGGHRTRSYAHSKASHPWRGRVELCSASVIVYWKLLKFGDGLVRRREFIRVVGELWAALPLHCRSRRAQRTRSCRWWGSSMAHHRPDTVSSYRHFATGWAKRALSRAEMSRPSTAGQKANTIDCRLGRRSG